MYVITKIARENPRIVGQKLYLANTQKPMWTLRLQDARPFKTMREAQRICVTQSRECRVEEAA